MTSLVRLGATITLFAALEGFISPFDSAGQGGRANKTRTFLFTYGTVVKELPPGKLARIWLPVPSTTREQTVAIESRDLPAKEEINQDKMYGNRILYVEARADAKGQIPLRITYKVTRHEAKTDKAFSDKAPDDKIARFLQPDAKVPVGGKPLELIQDKKVPADSVGAAKVFYDLVNGHMRYSKEGTGWGQGDAVWACDSKFGNCTDFHSLFISLARSRKIPAKFEMGFSLPPERGSGAIGGYHCWAWFLVQNKGWVPVDISEANRHPALADYYFGNLTEDRVAFSTGRDLELAPRQQGPLLNYFIYPYVEVDGKVYPAGRIDKTFSYRDVPASR